MKNHKLIAILNTYPMDAEVDLQSDMGPDIEFKDKCGCRIARTFFDGPASRPDQCACCIRYSEADPCLRCWHLCGEAWLFPTDQEVDAYGD